LAKYPHNTPSTCHFSIKKINKLKFISYFFFFKKKKEKKMGVWGGVISQPQPDFPYTPPVTVRLQRRDDRFYSPAQRVPIRNHQLANLGRAQACPALKNIFHLREKLVIHTSQVAIS
jgi:hypothetical protein